MMMIVMMIMLTIKSITILIIRIGTEHDMKV